MTALQMSLMKLTQTLGHLPSARCICGPFFFFFLLLTPKISTLPFPPNHPQCLHTDDLMLFHDILENKGQEYYHVGTKEQKETVTTLDYTVKQGDAQEKRAA